MTSDRMPRHAVAGSLWVWNPESDDGPEVCALRSGVYVVQSDDDKVMICARGKEGGRYERSDSMWLELDDDQALRLIADLSRALTTPRATPRRSARRAAA